MDLSKFFNLLGIHADEDKKKKEKPPDIFEMFPRLRQKAKQEHDEFYSKTYTPEDAEILIRAFDRELAQRERSKTHTLQERLDQMQEIFNYGNAYGLLSTEEIHQRRDFLEIKVLRQKPPEPAPTPLEEDLSTKLAKASKNLVAIAELEKSFMQEHKDMLGNDPDLQRRVSRLFSVAKSDAMGMK